MGQNNTSLMQEYATQILSEQPEFTLLSTEIHSLTYENFLRALSELNSLSKKRCLDPEGYIHLFALRKGTDSSLFWKATVEIAWVKVDQKTNKATTQRILSLNEFLKVFKTLTCQVRAEAQSTTSTSELNVGNLVDNIQEKGNESPQKECCICLERSKELILPCMHSFCAPCIEEWNVDHDTCPICRERFESTDDSWLLSEAPRAEEIEKEIRWSFMELSEQRE